MYKLFKLFVAGFISFLLLSSIALSRNIDLLRISDPGFAKFGKYKKPPVFFSHDTHVDEYKIKCPSCHHIYKNRKNVWTPDQEVHKCSECHGSSKAELINAYHMKCWGCHKRLKEEYSKADVPTSDCKRCHIPKKNLKSEMKRIKDKVLNKDLKLFEVINKLEVKGFYK